MVNLRESQTIHPWHDSGPDADWDDDIGAAEALVDDEDFTPEQIFDDETHGGSLAAWQRIEIARENRKLRSILNDMDDFDDYDDYEYSLDDYSDEYSY